MRIFGNICAGLICLGIVLMFRFVSQSVSRYDYLAAGLFSMPLMVLFFGVFASITATGKLDFLGWPRVLQCVGVIIACLSLTVLMGMSAALHGSEGREFPWSIRPFCPWAAIVVPFLVALLGVLWLNAGQLGFPETLLRVVFGLMITISLLSNVGLGVEIRIARQRAADEEARTHLAIVEQTDPEKEFYRVLQYTSRSERPATRQRAMEKVLATGPRFNALMTDCLRNTVFEEGLKYLRDNDPPGDASPLAEPARDAISQSAKRLRDEIDTGRPVEADDIQARVDSILTVAGKFSKYGVDFVPAVRECRAALDAPKQSKVPASALKKMDAWLASQGK